MRVGDLVFARSIRAELGEGTWLEYAASGRRRLKKGEPRPAFALICLGQIDDLEKQGDFKALSVLHRLGWIPMTAAAEVEEEITRHLEEAQEENLHCQAAGEQPLCLDEDHSALLKDLRRWRDLLRGEGA